MLTSEQKNDRPCEKSLSCEKIDNEKKDLSHQCPIEVQNLASIIFSIMFINFEINRYYEWFEYQIIKPDVLVWDQRREIKTDKIRNFRRVNEHKDLLITFPMIKKITDTDSEIENMRGLKKQTNDQSDLCCQSKTPNPKSE